MRAAPRRLRTVAVVALLLGIFAAGLPARALPLPVLNPTPAADTGFELVGHHDLFARGMNAAPALYEDAATNRTFVYVGSRTDSSNGHPHPGLLVLDTTNPAAPAVVNEVVNEHEGNVGETSRELRVWPEAKLLLVMHFTCSSIIHACDPVADNVDGTQQNIVFYDLTDPVNPTPVVVYEPAFVPHEMFLWVDPANAGRALLYMTAPTSLTADANLVVVDISGAATPARTQPVVLARWNGNADIEAAARREQDVRLHSIGVSPDGTRAHLAYLGAGYLVLDTSALTNADLEPPIALTLVTETADRVDWGSPGTHSAVPVLGTKTIGGVERKYAITTDEVYGEAVTPLGAGKGKHGCPWGWTRVIDITDEAKPVVVSEYKIDENDQTDCATPEAATEDDVVDLPAYACSVTDGFDPTATAMASYSSHNPTVLNDLALITWHGGGLQAVDLSDPLHPTQAGEFVPTPLPTVATEDPALSSGLTKVVMWSYPILNEQAGSTYVYVLDVRNGLYILRYTGAHADEIDGVDFLEGNSNLGDALRLDGYVPSTTPPPTGISFGAVTPNAFYFDSALNAGDAQKVAEFGAVDDGPKLTRTAPAGPTKVQTTSRFGNTGLPGNPLLSYFTYGDPLRLQGSPTLRVWLSAPSATGVTTLPLNVELFVDGTGVYGTANDAGTWAPISFTVDAGPVPQLFELTLPPLDTTALDSVVVQLGSSAGTTDANPKALALLYGSPEHDSGIVLPAGFPA